MAQKTGALIFDETEDNHEYRKTLEQIYKDKGAQYLYNMLKRG